MLLLLSYCAYKADSPRRWLNDGLTRLIRFDHHAQVDMSDDELRALILGSDALRKAYAYRIMMLQR